MKFNEIILFTFLPLFEVEESKIVISGFTWLLSFIESIQFLGFNIFSMGLEWLWWIQHFPFQQGATVKKVNTCYIHFEDHKGTKIIVI